MLQEYGDLQINIVSKTDIGKKRQHNEDYVGVFVNKKQVTFSVIADGVTTQRGGDVASEMVVKQLGHEWEQTDLTSISEIKRWLNKQLSEQNDALITSGKKFNDLEGMATTFVGMFILLRTVLIANLGDSRAYQFKKNKLKQVTIDHSYGEELRRAGEKVENSPMMARLTRFLGITDKVETEYYELPINDGDKYLLTTDGLTKLVGDAQIMQMLVEKQSLLELTNRLIDTANDKGGNDNISVLVANIQINDISEGTEK